jgi:multiple antibiotic resistance protein
MYKFSALALALFFVIDALGHIPTYLQLIKPYQPRQQFKIVVRELFFALLIMLLFYFLGQFLLTLLDISAVTVRLAGGIILFLIAIRLIFSNEEQVTRWKEQEPFIVPLATPMIAGPSVLAIIMIFAKEEISHGLVLEAIVVAWGISSLLFIYAKPIYALLKDSGLDACQKLMGLIVALIAIQMFINGLYGELL